MAGKRADLYEELPVSPAAPALARQHLKRFCADCPELELQTALLLTSELVSNAVLHGQPSDDRNDDDRSDEDRHIALMGRRTDHALAVEVSDPNPSPPIPAPFDRVAERGRGLLIIAALATAWGSKPGPDGRGKTVWFELLL